MAAMKTQVGTNAFQSVVLMSELKTRCFGAVLCGQVRNSEIHIGEDKLIGTNSKLATRAT